MIDKSGKPLTVHQFRQKPKLAFRCKVCGRLVKNLISHAFKYHYHETLKIESPILNIPNMMYTSDMQ